jgi:hypothetical protein
MDEPLRWFFLSMAIAVLVVGIIGGMVTRVAGRWRDDDDRVIHLQQLGPWVSGKCKRPGGGEVYKGLALFGHVRLTRYTWGTQQLEALGFAPSVLPLLEGRAFANLAFRLEGAELRGQFWGRRFTTRLRPPAIERVTLQPPQPRVWVREV